MKHQAINFNDKLAQFHEHWQPRVIAEMNNYQFKLVKVQGDFIWHHHDDTDETFIVLEGKLRIDLADDFVELGPGEMFVVPRGIQHKTHADQEAKIMIVAPRGLVNTGNERNERTAKNDVWV